MFPPFGTVKYNQATLAIDRIDAANDWLAIRFVPLVTTPIKKCEIHQSTTLGSPGNIDVVLTADNDGKPNVSGGAPVDVGGGSPTLVTGVTPSNGINVVTFTNDFTPTLGTFYWVVFRPSSGATFDGSNRRDFFVYWTSHGGYQSNSVYAITTDGGSTWSLPTTISGSHYFPSLSLKDASDNFLPLFECCCVNSSSTAFVWDDADNPDERGTAFDLPHGIRVGLWGAASRYRLASASSNDFEVKAYINDAQIGNTLTIDVSAFQPTTTAGLEGFYRFVDGPFIIDGPCRVRVAMHPLDGTNTITIGRTDFGSDARRMSCMFAKDQWYCNRNNNGAWTDDKTQIVTVTPFLEYLPTRQRPRTRNFRYAR